MIADRPSLADGPVSADIRAYYLLAVYSAVLVYLIYRLATATRPLRALSLGAGSYISARTTSTIRRASHGGRPRDLHHSHPADAVILIDELRKRQD